MEKIPTISAKISNELLTLVKAKGLETGLSASEIVRDALALYFGMDDQVSRDIPDVYQLRTEIEAMKLKIGELEVYTGYTAVHTPMIEHEILTDRPNSDPIATPAVSTRTCDFLMIPDIHRELKKRGCRMPFSRLENAISDSLRVNNLPEDLSRYGLRGDFVRRNEARALNKRVQWLYFLPTD